MRNDGGWQSDQWVETWRRSAARRSRYLAATTDRMIALAQVREGSRVLDLGTGTGDTAILLARHVGAFGHVVATDVSAFMIRAARETIGAASLANVTLRVMDAGAINLEPGSFDAVVGRMFLMFAADVGAVLAGARRVLRPGGRFATTTWGALECNPFQGILLDAVRARGRMPPERTQLEQAFSLHDAEALARALESTGFSQVAVERVSGTRVHESLGEAVAVHEQGPAAQILSGLSDVERGDTIAEVARAYAAFSLDDGRIGFPMETLVASATVTGC